MNKYIGEGGGGRGEGVGGGGGGRGEGGSLAGGAATLSSEGAAANPLLACPLPRSPSV